MLSESSSDGAHFPSNSAVMQVLADCLVDFDSGASGVMRWLEKPPDPSAVQAQKPKTRVVPLGMLLASFDPAIEFANELAESPIWHAS